MRGLAIVMLAGLLAVTAPSAQALCAVDAEGGCSRIQHFVHLDISEDCADAKALCIADRDGNFSFGPNDADWDITIHNPTGSPVTFELFAFGRYDDDGMPVRDERIAPLLLATIEVAAGQSVTLDDVQVPGNVSYVRAQAMADGDRQAEAEAELANFRILMMQPGEAGEEPATDLDDDAPADVGAKDAPGAPVVLLLLALAGLALAAGFRRDE